MKTFAATILVTILAALVCPTSPFAQEKPKYDMGRMQLFLLRRSPDWKAPESDEKSVAVKHRKHVDGLVKDRKLALAGEVSGDGSLREIVVIKTESAEAAKQTILALPGVAAGMLRPEQLSWYAARNVIGAPTTPPRVEHYVFGLLVRGPNWTNEETEATRKIQEGHMANIGRLAETGKLVLAGPFVDGGDRRGVFIFKVATLEEAEALTNTDPAVVAGRLRIELHHWSLPGGMLP